MTAAAAPAEPAAAAPTLVPLHREPQFRRFWAGQTVSVFGDQVSALAIPLVAVLALHASTLEVGVLASLAWLPHLLFSLPAGIWIDRHPYRRRNMIVADGARAVALATVPVAWWLGVLTIWQLLAVAFAVGAFTVFFDLSYSSFFVALVHRRQYVDANSKLSTSRSVSYIAGPSTAGVLVQVLGAPVALLGDALSFIASAAALRGIRVQEPEVVGRRGSVRSELVDGFRFLFGHPLLRAGLLCTSTVNFFNFLLYAIFVLYASRILGLSAATIGFVLGAGAVGALIGALVAPRIGRRIGIGRAVVIGSVLFPAPLALFPLAHGSNWLSATLLLVGEFFAGVGVMIFDVNQNALIAMVIPNEIRSRVGGVHRFFNYGVRPIGALLGGVLGAVIGLRPTLWISVIGCLFGVFFLLASPMPHTREEDLA